MERRKFTREFKLEAVKLIQERGVTVAQAPRDLGVHGTVLRRWVQECAADSQQAFPGQGQMKPEQGELARLRREVIFPRFHGHRVKSPSPSLRTRRGSSSRGSNAGGLDYRILRSIRICLASRLRVSDSADDARVPFSAYGRNFPQPHCPSNSHADSCSPSGRDRLAIRGTGWRRTGTRGPYDAPRRAPVVGVQWPW